MKRCLALAAVTLVVAALLVSGCGNQPQRSTEAPLVMAKADPAAQQTAAVTELPEVPAPDPAEAEVPAGYEVSVLLKNLTYPTSVAFDDQGVMYIAEAGYSYGDERAVPRLLRFDGGTHAEALVTKGALTGPVNDLLWHNGKLYISHRGKISVLEGSEIRDLVTGLPSDGDHHNNQISAGPDGRLYFGQGTASNSGVIGPDNHQMGWLAKHPEFHDIPARPIKLVGQEFASQNPLKPGGQMARTAAFHPFNRTSPTGAVVAGQTKANGTILRMLPDGSQLEVYAWGLRNPFGVAWTPDGRLLASENGFDARGSRPIANDKEDLYEIKQSAWYGWPDFAFGQPVTNALFALKDQPPPAFVMLDHPTVQSPLMTFPPHSAATKLTCARTGAFAPTGTVFLAFFGHMAPMTGQIEEHGGHRVLMIDLAQQKATSFFAKKSHHGGNNGGQGHANGHESLTAGPRRLIDVEFSPQGDALYVVDFGTMIVTKDKVQPVPRTGVIWKITRQPTG